MKQFNREEIIKRRTKQFTLELLREVGPDYEGKHAGAGRRLLLESMVTKLTRKRILEVMSSESELCISEKMLKEMVRFMSVSLNSKCVKFMVEIGIAMSEATEEFISESSQEVKDFHAAYIAKAAAKQKIEWEKWEKETEKMFAKKSFTKELFKKIRGRRS